MSLNWWKRRLQKLILCSFLSTLVATVIGSILCLRKKIPLLNLVSNHHLYLQIFLWLEIWASWKLLADLMFFVANLLSGFPWWKILRSVTDSYPLPVLTNISCTLFCSLLSMIKWPHITVFVNEFIVFSLVS